MINTDGVQVGQSATDTNNFLITTDGAGGLQIKRKPDGSGGNVLTVSAAGVISQSAPQSLVRLATNNGYGSINNRIGRFLTVIASQGTDITYADSATLGASFTINTAGVYSFSAGVTFNATAACGLSLNTSSPTTGIWGIPTAEILVSTNQANATFSWTGYLAAGSVVRPHYDGNTLSGNPSTLAIARVA